MKEQNEVVFAKAIRAKIEKSDAIGSLASWSTADHLGAVAECLRLVQPEAFEDTLQDVYNISGFQQRLEKMFKGAEKKHFQREGRKAESLDSLMARLSQ